MKTSKKNAYMTHQKKFHLPRSRHEPDKQAKTKSDSPQQSTHIPKLQSHLAHIFQSDLIIQITIINKY